MIDFLKNRKVQIAAQAVVITGLVGGTGAVLTMNKPVTLEVNGKAEEIRTFGGTVGEILDSQNIELEKRDEVKPGVNTKIDRDMTVTVNTAKDVALTVDGKKTDEWTNANTVGQALADLGVEAKDAELSAEATDKLKVDGETSIDVTTAKALTVVADGKDHKVTAPVDTAGAALKEADIKLDKDDYLSVPMSASVTDGQVLTVNRVENKTVKEKQDIEPKVEKKKSDSLFVGETKVEEKGKAGQKEVEYQVKIVNGEEVEKEKKGEKVLSEPKAKVVVEGTKKKEKPSSNDSGSGSGSGSDDSGSGSGGGSDDGGSSSGGGGSMTTEEIKAMLGGPGSKWYQVAKCESNFNPRAVNKQNNAHFGLFQFKLATWRSVGGSGNPIDASPREQFDRAKKLQAKAGWGQWACA
ncbi:resuscitation-promoting factor [Brevibacterium casei]|uniref:Transglycosylase n=1 Tax=Brevibacterium casei S18 TaxID=1229781 RepID=K9AN20_9MICO|nr:resuscitation-promoting factor [Brevibacterium casei]EKU48729.1 transglycosylase [Brevibacterium casei S18]MCT1446863.1 ubiquitin-like domain-containing protein [Brevibacterium casei]MCT1765241.1 ubiquitin-like domain-containing protein [Brevibacterium casei]QZE25177.1 ubiquitin-like domain-containing protein [Brevibacterium casei]